MHRARCSKVATTTAVGRGCAGRLRRECKVELGEQELDVAGRFGVADEEEFAAVGGGHGDFEHLHGGEFLEDGARHQAAGQAAQLLAPYSRLLGAHCGAWAEGLMAQRGPEALRVLQGLLALACTDR